MSQAFSGTAHGQNQNFCDTVVEPQCLGWRRWGGSDSLISYQFAHLRFMSFRPSLGVLFEPAVDQC